MGNLISVLKSELDGPVYPDYKDPFDEKYLGHPSRITPTQIKCWPLMKRTGSRVVLIGGKGAGKTVPGAASIIDRAQRFPGCKLFMAASTYDQAIASCADKLVEICRMMSIPLVFKKEMTIDKKIHKFVYFFPEFGSYCCVRSADKMDLIEGSEWDGAVIEEISFWDEDDLSTALSRLRRKIADRYRTLVGMPEDPEHWMYKYFEKKDYILFEINTNENPNLPPDYVDDLYSMYSGSMRKRFIEGKRVSLHKSPMYPNYDYRLHRAGLSNILCNYDRHLPLYITYDFNVSVMCVSIWQVKSVLQSNKNGEDVNSRCLCQIGEYEIWDSTEGHTQEACDRILRDYGDHKMGVWAVGDASGNAKDTRRASVTDWSIIIKNLSKLPNFRAKKGLVVNRSKEGITYSNPPLKDSILELNSTLVRPDGTIGMFFLKTSEYESGGAASSVSSSAYNIEGKVDESNDAKLGPGVARTHFAAGVRYVNWFVFGRHKDYSQKYGGSSDGSNIETPNKSDLTSKLASGMSMRFMTNPI